MKNVFLLLGASSDLAKQFIYELDRIESTSKYIVYGTYFSNSDDLLKMQLCNIDLRLLKCDLANDADIESVKSEIEKQNCLPSYIIHFAANKFEYMRIRDFDWEKTKYELDIQVGSLGKICKWLLPNLKKEKFGRVIAIGTEYTLGVPPKFLSYYVITKYALVGFIKALASEYSGSGITFNVVSPAMMETKFLSNIDERTKELNANNSVMKRNIELKEVCGALKYLISDEASYTTGINLNLSGGTYM